MDFFTSWQQVHDDAMETLNKTDGKVDSADYGSLANEYGSLLKHYKHFYNISYTPPKNFEKYEFLSDDHFDMLTGIFNQQYLQENLDRVLTRSGRVNDNVSVIMVDIDHFTQYNSTYGRDAGDKCLRYISEALKDCLYRGNDFVARYGDDEFVAVLPATNAEGAKILAERIQKHIQSLELPNDSNTVSNIVSITMGVVSGTKSSLIDTSIWTAEHFIKRAGEALCQAKDSGRNQYVCIDL